MLPASLFKLVEKVCANFLWGILEEGTKYHWIGWSQLCYPVEEGGVELRRLSDSCVAFSCKLWWQFRIGASLWTSFMWAKYYQDLRPCQIELSWHASGTWRRMLNISRQAELSIVWRILGVYVIFGMIIGWGVARCSLRLRWAQLSLSKTSLRMGSGAQIYSHWPSLLT